VKFFVFSFNTNSKKNQKKSFVKKLGASVLKMSVKGDENRIQILSSVSAKNIFARTSCRGSQVCGGVGYEKRGRV
jgi:hypothetical protein